MRISGKSSQGIWLNGTGGSFFRLNWLQKSKRGGTLLELLASHTFVLGNNSCHSDSGVSCHLLGAQLASGIALLSQFRGPVSMRLG